MLNLSFLMFFLSNKDVTCTKLNVFIIMTISNFYFTNNHLMRLIATLLYLHDDTFLKSSKEFIY